MFFKRGLIKIISDVTWYKVIDCFLIEAKDKHM